MPTRPRKRVRRRVTPVEASVTGSIVTSRTQAKIERERQIAAATGKGDAPAGRTLVPLKKAAVRLGLSEWGLRYWVRNGKVAHHRVGTRVMISDAEIERVIRSTEVTAASAA